jgi:flagellar biosynthesis/type III secretory pathway M-ring protein FliF/YscJ
MKTTEEQAKAIASRVSANVGFDPITIITIITTVLPLIAKCFNRNDEADPQQVQASVKRQHEKHPRALLKRTTNAYMREQKKAGERITREQAEELAKATIAQAIEANPQAVASVCAECC